jgi:multidrug efflux pump subunit AcrA (membrane-fusion protein)
VIERGTGTIRARALFDNADGFLTPGQFGILRMPATEVDPAILIPEDALVSDQSNKLVITLDENNVVVPKLVRPGPGEFGLRIIREGLDGSERIIINGLARARPGQTVAPVDGEIVLGDGRL